jgi:hypothetical protein
MAEPARETARTKELDGLVVQTAVLLNEAFESYQKRLKTGSKDAVALGLDSFAAKCGHLVQALQIVGERASQAAEELLD